MKVTYTQNRFEIDGVPVIDAEVLTRFFYTKDVSGELLYYTKDGLLKDGDSFDLPDNIIAEKEDSASGLFEVYRLKLKEPLVEKETFKEVESHKVLRKNLEDVKGNESYPLFSTRIKIMKAMEEYSQQQLNEERYLASFLGVWCRVEVVGENKFLHAFPSNTEDVELNVLEGEYRPSLFTCWMASIYPDRIKITPLEAYSKV